MKETVLQFGTGNFLRGFADCFIDALNKKGLYDGRVVVVSPTNSKTVAKINASGGRYNLVVRGVENGKSVCRINEINAITRAINPYSDFEEFLSLAGNPELRFIVSNTTEAGIRYDPLCKFSDKPAASFPAKLTQFLYRRYKNGLSGFVILACELIDGNGAELKKCVLKYAEEWGLEKAFSEWINRENSFCSTLVDRIVTGFPSEDEAQKLFDEIGYSDELLDTAEPYHLWAIEGDFEDELPLKKAGFNVIWTDDVSPYKKMKVRILNGSHTSLVFPSLLCGVETVRESLNDRLLNEYLNKCLFGFILPTLGETEENKAFANAVLERFRNPYIRHLWKSISLNSVSKFTARVLPTVKDYVEKNSSLPEPLVFSLACLIEYYKTNEVQDKSETVAFIKDKNVTEILSNTALW
ncbi:MAG: tagaturonate reductase, partial [Oscillospiraceae bacterium]|nr:tagaturonate reductase [Oscillospiraceae bacterium]